MLRTSIRRFTLGASRAGSLTAIAAAISLGFAPQISVARAQVSDTQPHWVAVTDDDVYLRCGDGVVWYPVIKVDAGQLLRVDGEGFKWLRVAYPKGAPAFIRAKEADLAPDGQSVATTRPTRMLAANLHSGVDGSWKALLADALPPGERLPLLGVVRNSAGDVVAYRVQAPTTARAYISEEFVRPATDAEIMAALNPEPESDDEAKPASDPIASAPQPQDAAEGGKAPAQAAEGAPAPAETIAPSPARPLSLHEVLERYGAGTDEAADEPPADARETPADEPQASTPPSAPGTTQSPPVRSAPAPSPTAPRAPDIDRRAVPSIGQLESAFASVMAQPVGAAEIDPLIREHERLINALLGRPNTEGQVAYLRRQVQLLNIKADLQESMRRLEEAAERAAIAEASINQRIDALESQRIYPHVGRLVASAIYDGKRLPLMYRLQTGSPVAPTTLAYVLPSDELDLRAMLGAIVGVQGRITRDDSLGVPIIRPARAEILARPSRQASVPEDRP